MSKQNALTEPVYYILLSLLTPMHGYGIMQKRIKRGAYKTKGACKKRRRIIGGLIRWIIHTSQYLNCFFSLDKELAFINKMNKEGWKLIYGMLPLWKTVK